MNRLFGSSKAKPAPNLTEVAANVDERNETVEKKIGKLDAELRQISIQMGKMRDGPGKNLLKQKALRIMRQKKVYMQQSEQLANQSFNISHTDFTLKSLQDTKATVDAMKASSKAMKREIKKINIDQVFDVQDDLADLMYQADEVQDALGQNFATPDVDESELEAELMALGDDLGMDALDEAIGAPSVPTTSLPEDSMATPAAGSKTTVNGVQLDEFGLPQIS